MSNCKVIAVANQKGGVDKTTTTANVAIGLARNGQEYLNADHIISIDTVPNETTIWTRLDTGEKYARSKKYLEEILDILGYYDSKKIEIEIG